MNTLNLKLCSRHTACVCVVVCPQACGYVIKEINVCVCMCVHKCFCLRVCVLEKGENPFFIMSISKCVHICLHTSVCVCASVSVYMHTHIHSSHCKSLLFVFIKCVKVGVCGCECMGGVEGLHCRQLVFSLFPCIRRRLPQLPENR